MKPTKVPDIRASLVFTRPVRDIHGVLVTELFETEAQWKLTARRLAVQLGPTPSPLLHGVKQALPQTAVHVIPIYEVTQVDEKKGHAVVLVVPAENCYERTPCGLVSQRDVVTGEERRAVLPYRELAARKREEDATAEIKVER